ncbi:cytochrome c biogenesis CcdA family protein [Geomesophilobacter sediminis]|uniref:Cytochrome c biogenesis protein CcdA n=1 Tax=Geomesophilobacter sediminis TaxID=2798584 RepID=A0A8J7IWL2_9BACT|nr:cytochrome c biogenesis protein CcdA [Geomesophilobacter sediminis]MBJ6723932.1 cytochrome c biogenesis protein CcdA [Geomesophilobacter sediminis]
MKDVTLFMAFAGGILSFFSPCVIPLVPSYLSFITGISFEELTGSDNRRQVLAATLKNSLLFVAGFSVVFILLGASSSFLGSLLSDYQDVLRKIGGVLIAVMGLYIAGVFNFGFLSLEKRVHLRNKPAGLLGSFLVGTAFAAGWTPCIGPVLGSILVYASTTDSVGTGITLLSAYAFGLALPFLITSLAINSALGFFRKMHRFMRLASVTSGVVLTAAGVMLCTGTLGLMTRYLQAAL